MSRIYRQLFVDALLLLLAVVAGLSVFIVRQCSRLTPPDTESRGLIPLSSDAAIISLELERNGHAVRVIRRSDLPDGQQWHAVAPWNRSGDAAALDGATRALRNLHVVRTVLDIADVPHLELKKFELDRPQYTWNVELNDVTWSLSIGSIAPAPKGAVYAGLSRKKQQGGQVIVILGELANLDLKPEQLLEPRLLPLVPSDIRKVTLDSSEGHMQFEFDGSRARWFDSSGRHLRISRNKIDRLLLLLTNLKAQQFLALPNSQLNHLGNRLLGVELGLDQAGGNTNFDVYENCQDHAGLNAARVTGVTDAFACIDAHNLLDALKGTPSEWLDRRLFSLRSDEIESLMSNIHGQALSLQREGTAFLLRSSESHPVDIAPGNELLDALAALNGALPAGDGAQVADQPRGDEYVQLRSRATGQLDHYDERVLIGSEMSDGSRWVKRLSDNAFLRIDSATASSLTASPLSLRSRELIAVAASAVRRIDLVRKGIRQSWLADDSDSLRPVPPVSRRIDPVQMDLLRRRLATLRAAKWQNAHLCSSRAGKTYEVDFDVTDEGNTPRHYSLRLANIQEQSAIAWLGNSATCFVPETDLVELVTRILD